MLEKERMDEIWRKFISSEDMDLDQYISEGMRPLVADSWKRSKAYGVDPYSGEGMSIDVDTLKSVLRENKQLIDLSKPIFDSLETVVKSANAVLILTDSVGYVLRVVGHEYRVSLYDTIDFSEGALGSTEVMGTSNGNMALDYDITIQLRGCEYYREKYRKSLGSACPIHGVDGEIVGSVILEENDRGPNIHSLGIVIAAAQGIENLIRHSATVEMFNSAFALHPDSTLVISKDQEVLWANIAAKRLLELSDQFASISLEQLFPEENWNEIWQRQSPYRASDAPMHMQGRSIQVSLIATRMKNPGKQDSLYLTIIPQKQLLKQANKLSSHRASYTFRDIFAESLSMQRAITLAKKYAHYDGTVLIEGESGTGKELFAQAIHNASYKANGPFIAINCAALPRDLIESELFGYEKGAFTGALKEGNPGKFELADGGTLFLDEIGEMPLEFQAKLLRVLETKCVTRIGGTTERAVDVRIIAATNRDLRQACRDFNFRSDLYFRLNMLKLDIPPLRNRPEDITYSTRKFVDRFNRMYPQDRKEVDQSFLDALLQYDWPGNVRELQNGIERTCYVCNGTVLRAQDAAFVIGKRLSADPLSAKKYEDEALSEKENQEKQRYIEVLRQYHGDVSAAAQALDMSRASLYRYLKKYNISAKAIKKQENNS